MGLKTEVLLAVFSCKGSLLHTVVVCLSLWLYFEVEYPVLNSKPMTVFPKVGTVVHVHAFYFECMFFC